MSKPTKFKGKQHREWYMMGYREGQQAEREQIWNLFNNWFKTGTAQVEDIIEMIKPKSE